MRWHTKCLVINRNLHVSIFNDSSMKIHKLDIEIAKIFMGKFVFNNFLTKLI
ncbi:hypothetical protein MCAMS1_01259 [biofilm metagenome]